MEQKALEILEKVIYATVATASTRAEPWNSPVYVVYDEGLNFYWASAKNSQHSRNILENPQAFIVVYDTTTPWGMGRGVFIQGRAAEVHDIKEITKVCQLREGRVPAAKHPPEEFSSDNPRSIYKLLPTKIWMNQDARINGYFVDERAQLDVGELRSLLGTSEVLD